MIEQVFVVKQHLLFWITKTDGSVDPVFGMRVASLYRKPHNTCQQFGVFMSICTIWAQYNQMSLQLTPLTRGIDLSISQIPIVVQQFRDWKGRNG